MFSNCAKHKKYDVFQVLGLKDKYEAPTFVSSLGDRGKNVV